MRSRRWLHSLRLRVPFVTLVVIAASVTWVASPAIALQARQPTLVSVVPAVGTPDVNNGVVYAIAQVGAKIILGGTFTSVSPADDQSTTYPVANTFAFNAATGVIDSTGYLPAVNGKVDTVIAGPRADEVYIGGTFRSVDGVAMRVALLNASTGRIVSGWKPPNFNGTIGKLVLAKGRLFVGGSFTVVGRHSHQGLVALDPRTGGVTPYVSLTFAGHHNYKTLCDPKKRKCATGRIGVKSFDINADATRLVAVGDFISVSGVHRDQIALLNLGKSSATLNLRWATLAYTSPCIAASFDSYVRDVQFSPNGSYFVVAATGGVGVNSDGTNSSCDAVARFASNSTGSDVRPTWIDYTGEDSLWSVAVTGTAVYVGGHQRWLNNPLGRNAAGSGAVPRPGIAALSPVSGLPLTWNPGRNPRGVGCFALLATSTGLWVGSDTDYIGNKTYLRQKIAFFPLAGGEAVPEYGTPRLPGRVFLAGTASSETPDPDRLVYREFNGVAAGAEKPVTSGVAWGSVDGAFTVGGNVIYGKPDGNLYERSFDGSTFGTEAELDPYNDPVWDSVQTGSGQTYQGQPSSFQREIPSVTSMFFASGRLYYTMSNKTAMHWRWFEPGSGTVGADEFTVSGSKNWSTIAGAFLAGSTLYFADATSGELRSMDWSKAGPTGSSKLVDSSSDWASRGLFALAQATNPTPTPVAQFTGGCGSSARCTFKATPWVDPDGGAVRYAWNFGDGTTAPFSGATKVSHRFLTDGSHRINLTVTDTAGARASAARSVTVAAPIEKVRFVGSATGAGGVKTAHVVVPRRTSAGDDLVLIDSYASTTVKMTPPAGWRLIGRTHGRSLTTAAYSKVAGAHAARRVVSLKYSRAVHSSLILAVYANTSSHPIERSVARVGKVGKTHTSPALRGLAAGSWAVGYWTQTSARISAWILPHGLKRRGAAHSPRRPADGAILADLGRPSEGLTRLGTARSTRLSTAAAQWVIALRPALR